MLFTNAPATPFLRTWVKVEQYHSCFRVCKIGPEDCSYTRSIAG